jgi:hypothetical protein
MEGKQRVSKSDAKAILAQRVRAEAQIRKAKVDRNAAVNSVAEHRKDYKQDIRLPRIIKGKYTYGDKADQRQLKLKTYKGVGPGSYAGQGPQVKRQKDAEKLAKIPHLTEETKYAKTKNKYAAFLAQQYSLDEDPNITYGKLKQMSLQRLRALSKDITSDDVDDEYIGEALRDAWEVTAKKQIAKEKGKIPKKKKRERIELTPAPIQNQRLRPHYMVHTEDVEEPPPKRRKPNNKK